MPDDSKVVNLYDYQDLRKERVFDSGEKVKSFFSGLPTVNESSSNGNSFSYLMGHQLMGFEDQSGNFNYFVVDGLNSVRLLLNGAGTETARYEHDEFGNQLAKTGTGSSSKTYVGGLGVHDDAADTHLLYMRARYYASDLGRFINRDPIGIAGGLNTFTYVSNSPTNFVDPSGYAPLTSGDVSKLVTACYREFINLGFTAEAAYLKEHYWPFARLTEGGRNISALPSWWPRDSIGFTNPLTKGIGLDSGECSLGANARTCSLLFHEVSHAMLQSKLRLLAQGIHGHWLKNPISKSSLEADIYLREINFLSRWEQVHGASYVVTDRRHSARKYLRGLIQERDRALKAAADSVVAGARRRF